MVIVKGFDFAYCWSSSEQGLLPTGLTLLVLYVFDLDTWPILDTKEILCQERYLFTKGGKNMGLSFSFTGLLAD